MRKFATVGLIWICVCPAPKATVPIPEIVPPRVLVGPSNSRAPVAIEMVAEELVPARKWLVPVPPVFSNVPKPLVKVAAPDGLTRIPAASEVRLNVPLLMNAAVGPAPSPTMIGAPRFKVSPPWSCQFNPPPTVTGAPEVICEIPSVRIKPGPSIVPPVMVAPFTMVRTRLVRTSIVAAGALNTSERAPAF